MAADVGLVTDAAQRQTGALTVHGTGHGQGHGGLAHAGRADKAEDLALGVRVQLADGDKLQNALLHLVQSVVVLVQNFTGLGHIRPVAGGLVPRQLQADIQIVADNGGLGAGVGLLTQPLQLAEQLVMYLLRQAEGVDLSGVGLQLLVAVLAQLVLEDLDLLAEDHVALDLGHTAAYLLLHLRLQGQDVHLVGQDVVDKAQALLRVQLLQHALAVLVAEGDVLSDEVGQLTGVPAVQYGGGKIVAEAAGQLTVIVKEDIGAAQQRLGAGGAAGRLLRQQLRLSLQEGLGLPQAQQTGATLTLHHYADGGVGGLDDLKDVADRSNGVEVALAGLGGGQLLLGDGEDAAVRLHGVVQRIDGDLALHIEGNRLAGKGGDASQGQDGEISCYSFRHGYSFPLRVCRRRRVEKWGEAAGRLSPFCCVRKPGRSVCPFRS